MHTNKNARLASGADYFKAFSKLYGRHSPRRGGDCKGLRPVSHFLELAIAHIEALAQLGRMLKETPKNAGSRGVGKSGVPNKNPTLSDLGLDKKTSSIARKLALLPPEQFEQVKAGTASIAHIEAQALKRIPQRRVS